MEPDINTDDIGENQSSCFRYRGKYETENFGRWDDSSENKNKGEKKKKKKKGKEENEVLEKKEETEEESGLLTDKEKDEIKSNAQRTAEKLNDEILKEMAPMISKGTIKALNQREEIVKTRVEKALIKLKEGESKKDAKEILEKERLERLHLEMERRDDHYSRNKRKKKGNDTSNKNNRETMADKVSQNQSINEVISNGNDDLPENTNFEINETLD